MRRSAAIRSGESGGRFDRGSAPVAATAAGRPRPARLIAFATFGEDEIDRRAVHALEPELGPDRPLPARPRPIARFDPGAGEGLVVEHPELEHPLDGALDEVGSVAGAASGAAGPRRSTASAPRGTAPPPPGRPPGRRSPPSARALRPATGGGAALPSSSSPSGGAHPTTVATERRRERREWVASRRATRLLRCPRPGS